jgi:hypothetical protein
VTTIQPGMTPAEVNGHGTPPGGVGTLIGTGQPICEWQ